MENITKSFESPNTSTSQLIVRSKSLSEHAILFDRNASMEEKLASTKDLKPEFRGTIEMIIGPMFAGKSTELLRRVRRHEISGKACLFVKYSEDVRYDASCISTHDS